jgi:hypothetical protein
MVRRLKSLATWSLLTCFVLLTLAHFARPLLSVRFDAGSGFGIVHSRLTRHITLETPTRATDIQPPRELGAADLTIHFVRAGTGASIREYSYVPLGPFWTGRILRRLVSSEPDGH